MLTRVPCRLLSTAAAAGSNVFLRSTSCAVLFVNVNGPAAVRLEHIPDCCTTQIARRPFKTSTAQAFHVTERTNAEDAVKTKTETTTGSAATPANQAQRMKQAVKEYGATVIVFHTCISLTTLGIAYAAVSSGLDVVGLLTKLGVGQSILESKLATGASTFVIAYACHKVFAPARMATTLVCVPLIVRYLRRIGFIKHPVNKP